MSLWDRDTKTESKIKHAAFLQFLHFGPARNLDRAFRANNPTAGESARAPAHWWRWMEDFNWKARAEAYDKFCEKIEREAHEEELRKLGKQRAAFKIKFQNRIERRFDKVEEQLGKAEAAPIVDIVRNEGLVTTKIKGANLSGYARLNQEWRATGAQAINGPEDKQAGDDTEANVPKAVLPEWLAKSFAPPADKSLQ